jgi:hypothetical protein
MHSRSVESLIHVIRGQKVMLDADLASLYGVPTKRLNEAVKRNLSRFPDSFMFTLSREEAESLRSQFATLETGRGLHPNMHRMPSPSMAWSCSLPSSTASAPSK